MARTHLLSSGWGRRLTLLQVSAALAQMIGAFVLPWLALERTGQGSISASVAALSFAGLLLGGLPLSRWVDRSPREPALRRIAAAMLLVALLELALLGLSSGAWVIWPLLLGQAVLAAGAAGVSGVCSSLAKLHLPPEQVVSSGAFLSTARQISWFGGQALGAGAVALAGAAGGLGLAAGCTALLLATCLRMPTQPHRSSGARLGADLRQLWRVPGLLGFVLLGAAWNFFVGPVFAVQVAFLHLVGGLGSSGMAPVYALGATGSLLAAWPLHRMCSGSQPARWLMLLLGGWAAAGGVYVLLGVHLPLWLPLGWAAVMFCNTCIAGLFSGVRSEVVPATLMAQGVALTAALHLVGLISGGLLGALAVARWGLVPVQGWSLLAVAALMPAAWWSARRLPRKPQPDPRVDESGPA